MPGLQPRAAAARRHRPRRARAAFDRARHAAAGRDRHGPALVLAAQRRRGAVGLRRGGARAARLRGGHRRRRGGRTEPAGARLDLHGRRMGRALGARARARSALPRTAPDAGAQRRRRRAVHGGRNADVAPAGRRPRAASRRRQGRGVPGDRLRPARREPLHEPPLLGGRRTQHADALRLDGALPRRGRQSRQPAPGPLARLLAGACARDHARARRRGLLALGLQLLGLRTGRTAHRADDGRVRRARRAPGALARVRPGARRRRRTRTSSARRSRRSPNTKANPASPRRSPTRRRAANSRSASRCSRR